MGNVSSVKDGRRFLPIHELCSSLSEITCRVLPGAHALSGCNTTPSFFGNGKKLVYKILKDAASDFHDLDILGDPDKDVAISCSSRFVARLYDQKFFASSHHNINKLRVKLVGMQIWLDYHLQKRRFVSIFFVPHSRPKFGKTTSAFTNRIRMANCQGFFASSLL
jgi:hypothetical protein